MTLVIKRQLVAGRAKTSAGTNGRKYITIHETANTSVGANAQAHANLQSKGFSASWHWQVDDKQAIQSFPHTVRCWHAGDVRGVGNYESIGVEICVNSDGDFRKAVVNAAELVRKIMADEGIPLSNVVQHNRWSGKNCPTNLRNASKGISWGEFIELVAKDVVQVSKPKTPEVATKPSTQSKPKTSVTKSPAESLVIDGSFGPLTVRALQRYFGTPVDGVISRPSMAIRALQKLLGVTQDGYFGPITIKALQRRFGTPVDGVLSKPSMAIKELQRRLNRGKL